MTGILNSLTENVCIVIQISLELDPDSPTDNVSSLVQVMIPHLLDDKPLPELILTMFTGAYMRHQKRGLLSQFSGKSHVVQ